MTETKDIKFLEDGLQPSELKEHLKDLKKLDAKNLPDNVKSVIENQAKDELKAVWGNNIQDYFKGAINSVHANSWLAVLQLFGKTKWIYEGKVDGIYWPKSKDLLDKVPWMLSEKPVTPAKPEIKPEAPAKPESKDSRGNLAGQVGKFDYVDKWDHNIDRAQPSKEEIKYNYYIKAWADNSVTITIDDKWWDTVIKWVPNDQESIKKALEYYSKEVTDGPFGSTIDFKKEILKQKDEPAKTEKYEPQKREKIQSQELPAPWLTPAPWATTTVVRPWVPEWQAPTQLYPKKK